MSAPRPVPSGFSDLATIPGVVCDIRYATADNFTRAPLPGYGAPGAWLLSHAAERLAQLCAELSARGMALRVWDAYRPRRASLAMLAWTERTEQTHLVREGYIARRSRHNSGAAIDLSLQTAAGQLLDMGTPWDSFTAASHTANATGTAQRNRTQLQELMRTHGWVGYSKEWWHFELPDARGYPLRDVPYGLHEPEEDPSIC